MSRKHQKPKSRIQQQDTAGPKRSDDVKPAKKQRAIITYHTVALLVFVALGLLIYSNTLNVSFVLDDESNIRDNPHIRLTNLNLQKLLAAGFKSKASHRPITNISFALNYYFHQYKLPGYHYVNIIIHILTAIFLFSFIKNTLSIPSLRSSYKRYKSIAFFAALLWFVHPIQTQAVTYLVQRMTSLSAMFYVLALLFYVKGRLAGLAGKKSRHWFTGCIISGILALGCKEMAATLPAFILLYEWYFFQDLNISWLKRYLPFVIGIFIFLGLLGLLYLGPNPLKAILSSYEHSNFTMTERVLTQFRVVIFYIGLLAYPHPGRLNLEHDSTISHSLIDPPTTLLCIAVIICLIVLAVCMAKKQRLLSFCILWFFGNLVMESSVLGLELVFEHRLYLPSMLISLAIVSSFHRFIKQNWVRTAIFCIIALLCSVWTYERNKVWSDTITLWQDCVNKSPEKLRPHNNLGNALQAQGKFNQAITHYRKALRIKPDYPEVLYNLGRVLQIQDKLDRAVTCYRLTLQVEPGHASAHSNLATVLKQQGKLDEAIDHYRKALQAEPDNADIHYNLGVTLQAQGKLDEAVGHYYQVLKLNPNDAAAHNRLGAIFKLQGKLDQAAGHYRQAMLIKPNYAEIYNSLGTVLLEQGKLDRAIIRFRQALQLKPDYIPARKNLNTALQLQNKPD